METVLVPPRHVRWSRCTYGPVTVVLTEASESLARAAIVRIFVRLRGGSPGGTRTGTPAVGTALLY